MILDEVDVDGNGEISFEEFQTMMYKVIKMNVGPIHTNNDEYNNNSMLKVLSIGMNEL
jgi:hypothetical protein